MEAHDFNKALELRGSEFKETLDDFHATSMLAVKEAWLSEDKASIISTVSRVGLLTMIGIHRGYV